MFYFKFRPCIVIDFLVTEKEAACTIRIYSCDEGCLFIRTHAQFIHLSKLNQNRVNSTKISENESQCRCRERTREAYRSSHEMRKINNFTSFNFIIVIYDPGKYSFPFNYRCAHVDAHLY